MVALVRTIFLDGRGHHRPHPLEDNTPSTKESGALTSHAALWGARTASHACPLALSGPGVLTRSTLCTLRRHIMHPYRRRFAIFNITDNSFC